jgi:hypothetical protein
MSRFGEKRIYTKVEDAVKHVVKKFGKSADAKNLIEYKKDKKKKPILEKEIIKQIDKG